MLVFHVSLKLVKRNLTQSQKNTITFPVHITKDFRILKHNRHNCNMCNSTGQGTKMSYDIVYRLTVYNFQNPNRMSMYRLHNTDLSNKQSFVRLPQGQYPIISLSNRNSTILSTSPFENELKYFITRSRQIIQNVRRKLPATANQCY